VAASSQLPAAALTWSALVAMSTCLLVMALAVRVAASATSGVGRK
jgi:hypothetical protein